MFREKEMKKASRMIKRIARKHHVSEMQVRTDIRNAIDLGRRNPDPSAQALWAEFRFAGPEPTVEEFILWAASLVGDTDTALEELP